MYLNRITFNQFDQGENRGMQILHVNRQYPLDIRYNGRTVRAVNYRGLGKVWKMPARTSENYEFQRLLPSGTSYDEIEGVYKKNSKEINDKNNGFIYGGMPFKLWRPNGLNEQQLVEKYGSVAILNTSEILKMFNNRTGTRYRNRADDHDVGIVVKVPKPNHYYTVRGPLVNYSDNGYRQSVTSFFNRKSGPRGHLFYAARLEDVRNKEFNFSITDMITGEHIDVKVKRFTTPFELDGSKGVTVHDLDFFVYNEDGSRKTMYIRAYKHITNGLYAHPDNLFADTYNFAFIGGGRLTHVRYDSGEGNSH